MTQIVAVEGAAHEAPPSIKTPGRILVHVVGDEFFVLDHDGSTFWIQEGVGFDYFLKDMVGLKEEGLYLITDIVGSWIRGDGWSTDDDEDWDWAEPKMIGLPPTSPTPEQLLAARTAFMASIDLVGRRLVNLNEALTAAVEAVLNE